jgi:hypothetical protein
MNLKSVLNCLILASLAVLCLDPASASAVQGPERAAKMSAALPRIEKVLVFRNGIVVINSRRAASLTDSERALARVLVENLNGRIRRGDIKIDQNLKVDTAMGKPAGAKDVGCDTHWWGEECTVDATTTQDIYNALETGEDIGLVCDVIPGVDVICDLLELVGTPVELELEPCADANDGSVFHYTWVGLPWFTCQ